VHSFARFSLSGFLVSSDRRGGGAALEELCTTGRSPSLSSWARTPGHPVRPMRHGGGGTSRTDDLLCKQCFAIAFAGWPSGRKVSESAGAPFLDAYVWRRRQKELLAQRRLLHLQSLGGLRDQRRLGQPLRHNPNHPVSPCRRKWRAPWKK
jgi:hypothetical protein